MKNLSFLNPPPLYVEIGQGSLKALREDDGMELTLERHSDGRLTAPCKEKTVLALKNFLKAKNWQPRIRAVCAVGARGVSLRRLSLPAGTREEFHQRLLLQIEGEFPLPPDELAWGCQPLGGPPPSNGIMAKQELLVAAVRKEAVADYHEILRACGTDPVFTLAALARSNLCAPAVDSFTMLDIGNSQSELTSFENNVPTNSRIIFWGSENVSGSAGAKSDALEQAIKNSLTGTKLIVSGNKLSEDFTSRLTKTLGNGCQCERLEVAGGKGRSAAIAGLEKFAGQGGPALVIRLEQTSGAAASLAALDWKKWGARIGALLTALLLLPYAEALLLKPHLAKKVAAFKAEAARLTVIDRELDFLRDLKSSQPPYLDVLYVLSKSVPPGTRFDSLSLNSHGEVSLRCAFHDGQQVADFRTKLIDSGFFANVTVEEQVPTPDHQKVNVRISAQEKTLTQLQALSASLPADETGKGEKSASPGVKPPGVATAAPTTPLVSRKETK
jgi:hypothetical protein